MSGEQTTDLKHCIVPVQIHQLHLPWVIQRQWAVNFKDIGLIPPAATDREIKGVMRNYRTMPSWQIHQRAFKLFSIVTNEQNCSGLCTWYCTSKVHEKLNQLYLFHHPKLVWTNLSLRAHPHVHVCTIFSAALTYMPKKPVLNRLRGNELMCMNNIALFLPPEESRVFFFSCLHNSVSHMTWISCIMCQRPKLTDLGCCSHLDNASTNKWTKSRAVLCDEKPPKALGTQPQVWNSLTLVIKASLFVYHSHSLRTFTSCVRNQKIMGPKKLAIHKMYWRVHAYTKAQLIKYYFDEVDLSPKLWMDLRVFRNTSISAGNCPRSDYQ